MFLPLKRENEFTLGDDTHVLRFVMVRRNRGACRIRGEQDIAILRLQFECVEWTGELWKITKQGRKVGHAISLQPNESNLTGPPPPKVRSKKKARTGASGCTRG